MEQQKWVSKLLGYDYEIIYKKGIENVAADALSRLPEQAALAAISTPIFGGLDDIRAELATNDTAQEIIYKLQQDPGAVPHYSWDGKDLRYKGRIVLLVPLKSHYYFRSSMHLHLLDIQATFALTNDFLKLFYWKGMRKEVKRFEQECDACQRNKSEL